MSPNLRLDVPRIKSEFVTGIHTSVRAAARHHGVAQATLARYAQEKDEQGLTWYDHRDAYMAQRTNKAYELLADKDAVQLAARQEKFLGIADMVADLFLKQKQAYEEQISAGKTPISVRDMAVVAELVRTMIGKPKDDTPKPGMSLLQIIGGNGAANGTIPDNIIAQLESAARSTLAGTGPRSVGPDSEDEGTD